MALESRLAEGSCGRTKFTSHKMTLYIRCNSEDRILPG